MNKKTIIELKNISKIFQLQNTKKPFFVLKNINLKINKGDKIGIIGNNGAGKTTLLKIIAGIVRPNIGTLETKGKVVSLMNLEDGFKFDLSGRENILLSGLLIGMTKKEIQENMEKIIDYSEIRRYIDEPFYKYSAGMKFRLAFSIAIASCCDVMIIDEVLTAGDFSFQQKVFKSLGELQKKRKKMATILCSHVPDLVWGFSDKYYLVEKASVKQLSKDEMACILKKRNIIWKKMLDLNKIL